MRHVIIISFLLLNLAIQDSLSQKLTLLDTYVAEVSGEGSSWTPLGCCQQKNNVFIGNEGHGLLRFFLREDLNLDSLGSLRNLEFGNHFQKCSAAELGSGKSSHCFLFQGLSKGILVLDVTDPQRIDSVSYAAYGDPALTQTQDVCVHDSTIYCCTGGLTGHGGLYVYSFSPAAQTIALRSILAPGRWCQESQCIGNRLFLLSTTAGGSRTIVDMFDADDLRLIRADTLACAASFAGDGQSLIVAADSFMINGRKCYDTLAICLCPITVGSQARVAMWVTDLYQPTGATTVFIDSIFLEESSRIYDAEYEEHILVISRQKAILLFNLSNLSDIRPMISLNPGNTVHEFAAFRGRSGHLELVIPRKLAADLLAIHHYRLE